MATVQPATRFPLLRPALWLGLILLAALLLPALARAQADGQRIDQVDFPGLVGYRPEVVLSRLKTQPGRTYSAVDVRADLAELGKIMRTATVQTEPSGKGGVNVHFVVTEFPRFRSLQVIGNQRVTTAKIESIARLQPGDVLDDKVQRSLKRALTNEYKAVGLPAARVIFNLIDVPADPATPQAAPQADLQVVVDEGKQILIDDLKIKGNRAFTELRLRTILDTKGSWTFIKNYYAEDAFKEDLARLREFYAAHGYFDAKVARGAFDERASRGKTVITPVINITEGQRYRFGAVTIRGARLFGQEELQAPFKPLAGKPFDGKTFIEAMDKLRAIYMDHGLLTTQFDVRYDYDPAAHVANVTVDITEKDRIYVGKVELSRPAYDETEDSWFRRWYARVSPPVKDEVVMREVLLKPGDVYNKQLERDSLRRLSRLGVFDPKTLTARNEPTGEPGVHNMVIEAQEAVTGALGAGVGYGDVTGAFLFAQIAERNLNGQADALSLQGMIGQRDSSVVLSYFDRHLRGGEDSLLSRAYFQNQYRPGYVARVIGATSEWGRPLGNDWTAYLRGRLEAVNLRRRSGYHPAEDVSRAYPVATIRPRFEQDTRYPFGNRPREGHLQSYGVEAGYAGGTLLRFDAMRDQYLPLTERLTYRLMGLASVMPYDADVLPIHERIFMGGDSDLRGFKYRGAGYFDREDDRVPIGGAAKLLVKNELHFPIVDPVGGVLFVDTGLIGRSPTEWQGPRVSAGTGLRFDLSNVQVALDAALPLIYHDQDQKRYFHFSLQSQF